jgi:hypothetical protein
MTYSTSLLPMDYTSNCPNQSSSRHKWISLVSALTKMESPLTQQN